MIQETPGAVNEGLSHGPPTLIEPGAPMQPEPNSSSPLGELHAKEAVTMAGWIKEDLASGKITQEQASKAWDQLGTSLEQRAPDTRTDEMKALDAAFPPAKGEEYLIRYHPPGQDMPLTTEQKAFDSDARSWLAGADFHRELGNSMVNTIERVATQTKGMNETQLEIYGRAEFAKLQRVYGDKVEEKLNQAGRMVEELEKKRPGLKQLLQSGGIGDSAMVANMLIQQSQRYFARRHKG